MAIFLDGSGLCGEVGWGRVTGKEDYEACKGCYGEARLVGSSDDS